jgi:hypothetical protein
VVVAYPEPEPIPMRPMPPRSSAVDMALPIVGPDGVRDTVNAHLNPIEAVWNFRSAWNVAALNCLDARYQPILDGYKAMLKAHSKRLTKVNADLDKQYRTEFGAGTKAIRAREAYLTQVYNYFALPPALDYFCEATLQVSQESLLTPPKDLDAFAMVSLPKIEAAFEHFFQDMERYRIDVAAWDARYGIRAPAYATGSGAVYTSATYGPPATDFTPARPVGEDFNLVGTPPAPAGVTVPQQPLFSSQPVVQPAPSGGS